MHGGLQPLPNYEQIMAWVDAPGPARPAPQRSGGAGQGNGRRGSISLILDKSYNVAYSTIPDIPAGISAESAGLWAYISGNAARYHFQVDATHVPDSADSLLILKLPRIRPEEMRLRNTAVAIVTYTSFALLVFSSLMSFFILRSLNGSIQGLVGATRRIAAGDLDFELPARGNDQISSLTRSFDSMRRALKEEYARRARFIMGVSHDLRTPLTLIQGYVEAIADGYAADPEAQKKYLSIILDKTRGLEGMVGDLIEFVRMETGQWRMTHRDVPIRQFLMDIARRFAEDALILKRDFGWTIDLPDSHDACAWTRACSHGRWKTSWAMPSAIPRSRGGSHSRHARKGARSCFPSPTRAWASPRRTSPGSTIPSTGEPTRGASRASVWGSPR